MYKSFILDIFIPNKLLEIVRNQFIHPNLYPSQSPPISISTHPRNFFSKKHYQYYFLEKALLRYLVFLHENHHDKPLSRQ